MSGSQGTRYTDDSDQGSSFDRDDFVREITSYYKFLVKLYIPESSLLLAPQHGWPDVTPEFHSWLQKNATVLDVMKHLPYIERKKNCKSWQVYFKTFCVSYNGLLYQSNAECKDLGLFEPGDTFRPFPAAVLSIAGEDECNTGRYFLLDTDRGTITKTELMYTQEGSEVTDPEIIYRGWRNNETKPYKEFFETLKEEFRSMYRIPWSIHETEYGEGESHDKRRKALKHCGWPRQKFDKENL